MRSFTNCFFWPTESAASTPAGWDRCLREQPSTCTPRFMTGSTAPHRKGQRSLPALPILAFSGLSCDSRHAHVFFICTTGAWASNVTIGAAATHAAVKALPKTGNHCRGRKDQLRSVLLRCFWYNLDVEKKQGGQSDRLKNSLHAYKISLRRRGNSRVPGTPCTPGRRRC